MKNLNIKKLLQKLINLQIQTEKIDETLKNVRVEINDIFWDIKASKEYGKKSMRDIDILWRNPGLLIKTNKDILINNGESMIKPLGECPLPIRITIPVSLSGAQIEKLGLNNIEGQVSALIEKESMFKMYVYGDETTGEEHVAVIKNCENGKNVPIRIHSSCLTAETFHASNCDCREQLQMALLIADKENFGGVIWLHQEGRGNGLAAKTKQLKIMIEEGLDTVDAFEKAGYPKDQRDYTVAAEILKDLDIKSIKLITNNPNKINQLKTLGIKITTTIPCEIESLNGIVRKDLKAKKEKMGHRLNNI
jgi:GTP cyclohydrolase II